NVASNLGRELFLGVIALTAFSSLAAAAPIDENQLPAPAQVTVDFARDIKPLLVNNCYKCHAGEKPKSHFLVTNRQAALKGGAHGVDVLPGQSARSPLIHYVSGLVEDMEMPPAGKGRALTTQEIGLLRAWIDQGVPWEAVEPGMESEATATPLFGWTTVNKDQKKFRELNWQSEGWNRGLEEFELKAKPTQDSSLTAAGHILRDDYKITLE